MHAIVCTFLARAEAAELGTLARQGRHSVYFSMELEWDPAKDRHNQAKHGVSFAEAITVFDDPLAWTVGDPDHSFGEHRFLTTGYSKQRRLIIVSHADRGRRNRLIGARQVTAAERRVYEEGD
jgi:uncharacterized protein